MGLKVVGPDHWDLWEDYCVKCKRNVRTYEMNDRRLTRIFVTVCNCSYKPEPHFIQSVIHVKCLEEVLAQAKREGVSVAELFKQMGRPLPPREMLEYHPEMVK